MSQLFVCFSQW